ncbi:ferredoxin reductase family protein [Microlunatus lacustris]
MVVRSGLLAGCVGAAAIWWVGTPAGVALPPGALVTSLGELTGMWAGVLICAQILLVARVPWFEGAVGLDRLVGWHRTLGTSVLLLTVTHVVLIVLGGQLTDRQSVWAEFWSVTVPQPDVLTALIGTLLLVAVGVSSARAARRRLSYEVWYWLHTTTYVAVFLTFGHQINAGAHFVGHGLLQLGWTALYLATAAAVLVYRVLLPLRAVLRHRVRVYAVVEETPTVTSIWLQGRHLDDLDVRAGQFFLFRFLARGHLGTAHPYSVSYLPTNDLMRVTVGALGDHSSRLRSINPGTFVVMEGPFGTFTAQHAGSGAALLVAGGAGIGPIRALAHQLADEGRDVVVLHRAPSAAELPLQQELLGHPRIRFIPVLGHRHDLPADPIAAPSLEALVPDLRHREVFICGSPGLTEALTRSLRGLGVPPHAIHHEELSMS